MAVFFFSFFDSLASGAFVTLGEICLLETGRFRLRNVLLMLVDAALSRWAITVQLLPQVFQPQLILRQVRLIHLKECNITSYCEQAVEENQLSCSSCRFFRSNTSCFLGTDDTFGLRLLKGDQSIFVRNHTSAGERIWYQSFSQKVCSLQHTKSPKGGKLHLEEISEHLSDGRHCTQLCCCGLNRP